MDELVAYRIGGSEFFNNPNIYRFSELIRLKKEKLNIFYYSNVTLVLFFIEICIKSYKFLFFLI